jgi:preprotein translocase subunit SecD
VAGPTTTKAKPWRSLIVLFVVILGLCVWAFWPGQDHSPKLGLDLQGGTQVTLVPKTATTGGDVSKDQLDQAVEIIRQRVNGLGVAEAEVTTQGSGGSSAIVVSVPGQNRQDLVNQLATTALLDFRPVIQEEFSVAAPVTVPNPVASGGATPTVAPKKGSSVSAANAAKPAATPSPKATAAAAVADEMGPPIQAVANDAALQAAFVKIDCAKPKNHQGGAPDDPAKWIVTCRSDGSAKYLLEPAFIRGTQVTDAQAALPQNGAGGWEVNLTFDNAGSQALADVSAKLVKKPSPQNQFAIVLDGLVQSSPYFQSEILGGTATISGNFTQQSAKELANILKYGALPVQLTVAEVTSVSPTLGSDQLQAGLLAGALGLFLVMLYLLVYYRALGLVAIISLAVAALITYTLFVILGRTIGLALTLASIAGAIVAIGITADSFVVYFERIRDEVRDGKSLRVACELGWVRARNTLLAADFVSILAASILYFISIGNVRGFAFVLGVTTIIDVVVAFMFTRPLVALLAQSKWFGRGGSMTGMSPKRLGVRVPVAPDSASDRKRKQPATVGAPAERVGATDEPSTSAVGES